MIENQIKLYTSFDNILSNLVLSLLYSVEIIYGNKWFTLGIQGLLLI
jgi:hypothetical protein